MNSQNYCSISTPNAIYYMWLQESWNIVSSVSGSAEHMYVILWKHDNERLIKFGSKIKLWSMKWLLANQHQQLVKYEAMLWIYTPMADPSWLVKEQPPLLRQGYKDTELKSDMWSLISDIYDTKIIFDISVIVNPPLCTNSLTEKSKAH